MDNAFLTNVIMDGERAAPGQSAESQVAQQILLNHLMKFMVHNPQVPYRSGARPADMTPEMNSPARRGMGSAGPSFGAAKDQSRRYFDMGPAVVGKSDVPNSTDRDAVQAQLIDLFRTLMGKSGEYRGVPVDTMPGDVTKLMR